MLNDTELTTTASKFIFDTIDYAVFGIMLAISASIGIYFGFFDKSSNTTEEYLLGGRRMKILPIAISLIASQMSATSIMTIPAETYQYGFDFIVLTWAMIFVLPLLTHVVIPVFYNNNISNCYEYLELRFDKKTRTLVTASYVIKVFLTIPLYMFVPSLGFSQVTGYNVHLINGIVCSVCIFYTMLGGIKAVVWTDVIQAGIMFGSIILVAFFAVRKIGGIEEVITRAVQGDRIHNFNWTLDFATRLTVWNCIFGGIADWFSHSGVNQSCVQRIVSLPSLRHARITLVIFVFGFLFFMGMNCLNGIIMFARYNLCDPVALGVVEKADKLLPFFVQDVIGHWKGFSGLFISCLFSAALSTMSANLNTLAGIVYMDYIKPFVSHDESRANFMMKIIVILTGIYCVFAGIIVQQFSSILQLGICIAGLSQGAITGIFLLGLLYPKAHSKAAFYGTICSMVIMGSIVISSQILEGMGIWKWKTLPTKIESCDEFNITTRAYSLHRSPMTEETDDFLSYFRISFYWFIFLGTVLVWIVAIPLSHILKVKHEKKLNPKLLASFVHKFLPEQIMSGEEKPLKN